MIIQNLIQFYGLNYYITGRALELAPLDYSDRLILCSLHETGTPYSPCTPEAKSRAKRWPPLAARLVLEAAAMRASRIRKVVLYTCA